MESRKKGRFSNAVGDLYEEIEQINLLEEEKCFLEENASYTKLCDTIMTIICC